jgi:hypothetical protein
MPGSVMSSTSAVEVIIHAVSAALIVSWPTRPGFVSGAGAGAAAGVWLSCSPVVHAQVTDGLTAVGQTVRLSSADPRVLAARIINVALGLLSIIFLGLTVYAGFLWMTSGGNADGAEKARTLLRNAVIGLIIILSSWAITRYVITRLLEATNDGGGGVVVEDGAASFCAATAILVESVLM